MLANADFVDGAGLHSELLSLVIEADRPRPTIPGPGPRETALALLRQMQAGSSSGTRSGGVCEISRR
jgi:hypothetical protein